MAPQCITLWVGAQIGSVERACLRSVIRHHPLALYCYERPEGVPEGVELRDAADILPADKVFLHQDNSFAPFSDWFRYELQQRALGTWVDSDIYLLAPLDPKSPYLFGEQSPGVINNAILRLPSDSPLVRKLLVPFREQRIPRWMPLRRYIPARVRQVLSGRIDFATLPWGLTGPSALSSLARRERVASHALPQDVFYPVPWEQAAWIRDSSVALEDVISARSVAVHLWNSQIQSFKDEPAPEGSFLHRLQREGC